MLNRYSLPFRIRHQLTLYVMYMIGFINDLRITLHDSTLIRGQLGTGGLVLCLQGLHTPRKREVYVAGEATVTRQQVDARVMESRQQAGVAEKAMLVSFGPRKGKCRYS